MLSTDGEVRSNLIVMFSYELQHKATPALIDQKKCTFMCGHRVPSRERIKDKVDGEEWWCRYDLMRISQNILIS